MEKKTTCDERGHGWKTRSVLASAGGSRMPIRPPALLRATPQRNVGLGMETAAEDTDGDRVIEIVSAGALYQGGEWERKYWSCSRGKDRYPYPVGYHTVRHFPGISYTMEIQEGPRGPVFLVTSSEGDSATGPTPDIAWKNLQKKSGAKVRNCQRRSFPQKIDGAELFGFKNASVQRLLRELIVDATGVVVQKLPCPVDADNTSPSLNKDTTDVCNVEGMHVSLDETSRIAKRIIEPRQMESVAKRVHFQDTFPFIANSSESAQGNANEVDGSGSRCGEGPDFSKRTSIDSLGEPSQSSSQQVDSSSGSYLSSEMYDLEAAEREAATFMMSFLFPQAIPFLKKSKRKKKKKSKQQMNKNFTGSVRTASVHQPSDDCFTVDHKPSDDCCKGVTVPTIIDEGTNINSSETFLHGRTLFDMVKDGCADDDYTKDESAVKLYEMIVEDSFEDNAHILDDTTSKSSDVHHHVSDDACSRKPNEHSKDGSVVKLEEVKEDSFKEDACILGDNHHVPDEACSIEHSEHSRDESVVKLDKTKDVEDSFEEDAHIWGDNTSKSGIKNNNVSEVACSTEPNENSKVLDGKIDGHVEPVECQVSVHNSTKTPDVVYDHEKGQYILSDSFAAFLEEEFGEDESMYPENYNQCGKMAEQMQVEQNFKDPTNGMKDDLSVSLDIFCHKNIGNGLVDLCAQAQCSYGNETTMMSVARESNDSEQKPPQGEQNVSFNQHDRDFSTGSGHRLEFVGCYLHPTPVLSIMFNTKNHSNLQICVLCGFLKSCQRFLYIYTITLKDQQDTSPCFVGHTPLLLPSLEQPCTGNFTFGRSGLQFTPDGRFLVLMSSIGIPFCRMQNIYCLCCVCKSHQTEDNSLKIVSVNFGYVSLITKLMPYGAVLCILICEPNYIIAAEDSRNLHIWKMDTGWRTSEDYVIPSLGHAGPSILELRKISTSSSLIIGHDGSGGFCLWDIYRRTLLATFAAPGKIVFQILPISFCSLQKDIVYAPIDDIEQRLQEITIGDMCREYDQESFLIAKREDIAIWVLVSSASVAEYQHDLQTREHNARWRLALLEKKRIFMGNVLDSRVTAVDTSGNYGFAGTYGGMLYMWELTTGRKLASTQCINGGRVSCIAVDGKSGAVAVADGCRLLLYTQKGAK